MVIECFASKKKFDECVQISNMFFLVFVPTVLILFFEPYPFPVIPFPFSRLFIQKVFHCIVNLV